MKKLFALACVLVLALSALAAQAAAFEMAEGQRYTVYTELGKERAESLSKRLDASFALFNDAFRFDESALAGRLVVREFKDREGFDAYVTQAAGQAKDDFVYLHYSAPARRELVIWAKEEPEYSASLAHQSFVQFVKAFVRNPPLWMREGFAVYFESLAWDGDKGELAFPENLGWLETAKGLKANATLLPLARLMTMGVEESRASLDLFYPQSWALVSFLANSPDKAYNRLLWDAISVLGPELSLEDNQAAVAALLDTWYGSEADEAFAAYLDERKTFPELVAAGVESYGAKDYDGAVKAFEAAAALNEASYVPSYYLGLIAYAKGDFTKAEYLYRDALQLGCDPGIANYALGVNAFAFGRNDDAVAYLAEAAAASPERYGAKVEELRKRIGK